jgi:hypothetical protein
VAEMYPPLDYSPKTGQSMKINQKAEPKLRTIKNRRNQKTVHLKKTSYNYMYRVWVLLIKNRRF